MKCELCGGLVTWRGPLSLLTHTECESCGERNCQIAEGVDERLPEMIVGHSEMQGGWCVYEHVAHADYDVRRGPFATETEANAALSLLADSKAPNVEVEAPLTAQRRI